MFTILSKTANKSNESGDFLLKKSSQYLSSLQTNLDKLIDKRLSRTFYDVFLIIIMFRNSKMGLLLSELGGYVCGFAHAPAGTKRISNLLRSKKWASSIMSFYLKKLKDALESCQIKVYVLLWDDSRIEKPESWRPTLGLWRDYAVSIAVKANA